MAKGALSPRQKMINLMYLVFIAMLALNMSKEVLSAFGLLDKKIAEGNVATTARNNAFMESLGTKATDAPEQYAALKVKADQVSTISDELDVYLEGIKSEMMGTLKPEDADDYEVQDKPDFLDRKFFQGDKLKPDGQKFIDNINKYRTEMLAVLGDDYPDLKSSIEANFSTTPVANRDGKKIDWINYNFEGFPLVASKTKLTQIQSDVKTTKSELLGKMLAGQQADALALKNYESFMTVKKTAFYPGETFDGSIILGRVDPNTVPKREELTLDGRKLVRGTDYDIAGGRIVMKIGAGSPGDHKIEGMLYYGEEGEETEVKVETGFATIALPNSAVIAADKMNVVYRGVDNPMTVSIPGIPDNKVRASGTGLSPVGGSKYVMRPGSGRTVNITASGTLPDGKPVSSSSEFRIKDIPPPLGAIRGETGIVRMQRQGLEISTISAVLPDFDFDVKLNVTGFSFKVSGQPTVRVNGTRLDGAAQGALRRAGRGDAVQIFDINAKVEGSSVVLKKTSPVIIELTN
ncbi:protein involved in gliding motility GldM [Ulvibacter sp. MAR_2010_11]|uniref:type IX secretion system motor protein PorM/GldM n=1 Tax=Ulvibacter sp. MAR_2010_11 TaxID=1250229 RepID=UPI000C2C28E0|nr:gliding motility protein GldM [Ulvibacter sp. MAR_2010_11]PKA82468.1 protein involved in gliding motility GldM [Ulvibacter sp. MAR_2010_11]